MEGDAPVQDSTCSAGPAVSSWLGRIVKAPRLPLKGCNAQRCECRYRHFADRRGDPRREDETGAAREARKGNERRSGSRGRRATD